MIEAVYTIKLKNGQELRLNYAEMQELRADILRMFPVSAPADNLLTPAKLWSNRQMVGRPGEVITT